MGFLGLIIVIIAIVVSAFYSLKILFLAFQESILWGLGSILLPFVGMIFVVLHWDKAGDAFLKSLLTIPVMFVGAMMLPQ